LEGHVKKWWKIIDNKKKIFGVLLVVMFVLLILTSFVLRHVKIADVQEITRLLHTIIGFVLIGFFVGHYCLKNKK
jgi:hypothetical protein